MYFYNDIVYVLYGLWLWLCGDKSRIFDCWVGDPQCVDLLEAKSCEYEVDYIWASSRGLERLSIGLCRLLCH